MGRGEGDIVPVTLSSSSSYRLPGVLPAGTSGELDTARAEQRSAVDPSPPKRVEGEEEEMAVERPGELPSGSGKTDGNTEAGEMRRAEALGAFAAIGRCLNKADMLRCR